MDKHQKRLEELQKAYKEASEKVASTIDEIAAAEKAKNSIKGLKKELKKASAISKRVTKAYSTAIQKAKI